jgi:hypothetical protein
LRSAADGEDFEADPEDDGLREVATSDPPPATDLPPSGSRFLMDGPAVPKAQN